jgi:hypothetical protein
MKNLFYILCVTISFVSCKRNQGSNLIIAPDSNTIVADSSYSKVYIAANELKKESVDFLQIEYPFIKEKNTGVVKVSKKSIINTAQSSTKTEMQIEPIYFKNKTASIEKYNILVDADAVEYRDACLFAKKNGTDTTEDMYYVFNPLSGEKLFTPTNDYFDLVIPNSKERRFFGFTSTKRVLANEEKSIKNLIGHLYYASNFIQIQEFEITAKDETIFKTFSLYTPKILLKTNNEKYSLIDDGRRVALMNLTEVNNASDFSNIQLEITFYYGDDAKESICIIPIKDDKLDISKSVYDKNLIQINTK